MTGKWTRARYVAELYVIAERHTKWEITGPPEIRTDVGGSFNPFRRLAMHVAHVPINEKTPIEERSIEDQVERLLVLLCLRRYATWCVRTGRFAQAEGARTARA